jgi:hypothetical protein
VERLITSRSAALLWLWDCITMASLTASTPHNDATEEQALLAASTSGSHIWFAIG